VAGELPLEPAEVGTEAAVAPKEKEVVVAEHLVPGLPNYRCHK
jgi:hypothetical protein